MEATQDIGMDGGGTVFLDLGRETAEFFGVLVLVVAVLVLEHVLELPLHTMPPNTFGCSADNLCSIITIVINNVMIMTRLRYTIPNDIAIHDEPTQ